ncbi:MAG: thiamine phosphate synthase [Bacteroidia bacterium]
MNLPKLQYISDGETFREQYENILSALDGGVQWIQLRWKNADENNIQKLAETIKTTCDIYGAILIINDHPLIAKNIQAHGVHLGLNDMPVEEARKTLSHHQWIGGTANTYEDVKQRIKENVTYIGLGPLRFTTTKKKLSPILGYEGYENILKQFPHNKIPIYAIGGITEKDIIPLLKTGIYGIAVSSLINKHSNKSKIIRKLNSLLYGTT